MTVQTVEEYLRNGGKIIKIPDDKRSDAFARYSAAKSRANKDGWEFDLTIDWVLNRVATGRCEATGIKFGKTGTPWVASLDRKDSNRGYTKDNCWVVCWAFNRAKGKHNNRHLIKLAKGIIKNADLLLKIDKEIEKSTFPTNEQYKSFGGNKKSILHTHLKNTHRGGSSIKNESGEVANPWK